MPIPKGSTSVMNRRIEPPDSLDFFPTPPYATRALFEHVLGSHRMTDATVWEPAAGEGHMAEVIREYVAEVYASDVHDYGVGYAVGSFVGDGPDLALCPFQPHWVITNPPFNLALDFVKRGLREASIGVAMLVRSNWLEGAKRYNELFRETPPTIVAQFVERVPMVKGRWDPDASTATSYCWVVWEKRRINRDYGWRGIHIPPGCRVRLEGPEDRERFAALPPPKPEPTFVDLLEEVGA
jgi:hypothetical protein